MFWPGEEWGESVCAGGNRRHRRFGHLTSSEDESNILVDNCQTPGARRVIARVSNRDHMPNEQGVLTIIRS